MKSLVLIIILLLNVWMFRKTIYLNSYQIYNVPIFLAAFLFILGEGIRSLLISKAEYQELKKHLMWIGLLTPFYRYLIDPVLMIKNYKIRRFDLVINLLHLRFLELSCFFLLSLMDLSLYADYYFKYFFMACGAYWALSLLVLLKNKVKVFEVRFTLYTFFMFILQLSSLFIVISIYKHSFDIKDYFSQFLPIIITEVRLNHFVLFIIAIMFLAFRHSGEDGTEEKASEA